MSQIPKAICQQAIAEIISFVYIESKYAWVKYIKKIENTNLRYLFTGIIEASSDTLSRHIQLKIWENMCVKRYC